MKSASFHDENYGLHDCRYCYQGRRGVKEMTPNPFTRSLESSRRTLIDDVAIENVWGMTQVYIFSRTTLSVAATYNVHLHVIVQSLQ
jgi:hypothetical protein